MAMLGTQERPAVVRVATLERAEAVQAIAEIKGWLVLAGVEPGEREDLTDLELLMTGGQAVSRKVGRNDPCPCGSGKKHKKCCEGKPSPLAALLEDAVARLGTPTLLEDLGPFHNRHFPMAAELDALWAWLEAQPWAWNELARAYEEFQGDAPEPEERGPRHDLKIRFMEWLYFDRPLSSIAGEAAGLTPLAASPAAGSALQKARFGVYRVLDTRPGHATVESLAGGDRYEVIDDEMGVEAGHLVFGRLYPMGEA